MLTDLLKSPNYRRAPITEAVIGLRVGKPISQKQQDKLVGRLKKFYPHSDVLQNVNVGVDASEGTVAVNHSHRAFRLTANDQTDVALIEPHGITIARLAPYLGWENLEERSTVAWDQFKRTITHQPVVRIGVRYINRIDVPLNDSKSIQLHNYLNFYPKNPCMFGGPMVGYLMQITQPTIWANWTYSITSTIIPSPLPKYFSFLLDIDVFRTNDIPIKEDELWSVIREARLLKNDIFERCITDNTRELISL